MYYKVLKTSETGKKIAALDVEVQIAFAFQKAFIKKIGAERFLPAPFALCGGVLEVIFPTGHKVGPEWKIATKKYSSYSPKLTTEAGRALNAERVALPTIPIEALHGIINYVGNGFSRIGYSIVKEHYLYQIFEEDVPHYVPPQDCIEIKASEYHKLIEDRDK